MGICAEVVLNLVVALARFDLEPHEVVLEQHHESPLLVNGKYSSLFCLLMKLHAPSTSPNAAAVGASQP